jgi:hypothetical protein
MNHIHSPVQVLERSTFMCTDRQMAFQKSFFCTQSVSHTNSPDQLFHDHNAFLIYRVSQEECARLREDVPYFKVCQYNSKHLCPKLNGYGDNGPRTVWSSGGSTHCTCQLTSLIDVCPRVWCPMMANTSRKLHM